MHGRLAVAEQWWLHQDLLVADLGTVGTCFVVLPPTNLFLGLENHRYDQIVFLSTSKKMDAGQLRSAFKCGLSGNHASSPF